MTQIHYQDLQNKIAAIAGVFPDWLRKQKSIDWLESCHRLLTAGVIKLRDEYPVFCESVTRDLLLANVADIAIVNPVSIIRRVTKG